MPANRSGDWWRQALHDFAAGRHNAEFGFHDWACFMSQQAAEKAIKALIQHHGGDAWGHGLRDLVSLMPTEAAVPTDVVDALKMLDRYYIPTRYPNGIPSGSPSETFGVQDSETALGLCEKVVRFVEGYLPRPNGGR
jgi:HEPN domain-containing protein